MKASVKYLVLGLLYFTQSIPIAFMGTALTSIMRSEGLPLDQIGYTSLVMIPYALSFLWAPFIDRYGRYYFTWVTIATILYALFLFPAKFLGVTYLFPMLGLFTCAVACMSVQDIAMDAFAITTLKKEERSIGNGIQASGNYFGLLLGGGGLLIVYSKLGWSNTIVVLTLLTLIPIFATIFFVRSSKKVKIRPHISLTELMGYFKVSSFRKWIPVLLLLKIPVNITFYFSNPLLIDKGLSLDRVGYIFGILGMVAAVVAGLIAGIALKKYPMRIKLFVAVVANFIALFAAFSLDIVGVSQLSLIVACCLVMGAMLGLSGMVLNDVAMRHVREGMEGTDYAFQNFLSSLIYYPLVFLSGSIAQHYGYISLFLFITGIAGIILLFVCVNYFIDR